MKCYAASTLTVGLLALAWLTGSHAKAAESAAVELKSAPIPAPVPVPSTFKVDLRTGSASSLPTGVTWHSKLTSSKEECQCDRQGVLKLTFDPESRVRAQINLTFEHSTGFSFNVGDSVTNNAWAGDSGTQSNDAELHSFGDRLYFYGRDDPAGGSYGLLHSEASYVAVQPYSTVSLNVQDELATAHNGLSYVYVNSPKLFALRGQSDASPGGVNHDVYLGMNRVVAGGARSGSGLCSVTVTFLATPL